MDDAHEFWRKSSSDVHHCARLKTYLDGSSELMVCSKPVFIEAGYESAAKFNHSNRCSNITRTVARDAADKAGASEASADRARRRAATKVRDIALSNRFRWFVTLTLDRERIDRYDVGVITKKLNQVMDNLVRRRGLAYVLVPERHKDGAVHFHGFFTDAVRAVESGHTDGAGHKVYNLPEWTLGFSTAIELYGTYSSAVGYVCKYVRKQDEKIGGRWFYSGGKLAKPAVSYPDVEWREAHEAGGYEFSVGGSSYVILKSGQEEL